MRRTTALLAALAVAALSMVAGAAHAEPIPIADPTITSPAPDEETGPSPTFKGTGEPGADLEVLINTASIGTTTIAEDGTWSLTVAEPLGPDEYVAQATQTVEEDVREASVIFRVPPPPPTLTSPADGSTTADETPRIAGTGTPDLPIVVEIDGEPYGVNGGYEILVADDGTWSHVLPRALACGEHTVRAIQPEPGGGTSSSSPSMTFTVTCVEEQTNSSAGNATGTAGGGQANPAPPANVLPATGSGSDLGLLAALGVALLGFGTYLLRRAVETDGAG